jgi:hypothetical protein
MKRHLHGLSALVTLLLVACGAAPEGTSGARASGEDVSTSSEAQQAPPPPRSSSIFITFDDVASNTIVNSQYGSVTFSCEQCLHQPVVIAWTPGGRTANAVTIDAALWVNTRPALSAKMGVVVATLTRSASCVTIDALGTNQFADDFEIAEGAPWLEAYDAFGGWLGRDDYTPRDKQWHTLAVCTGSFNIASVKFSSGDKNFVNPMQGTFDNLHFDQAPFVRPPPILPLPPSIE